MADSHLILLVLALSACGPSQPAAPPASAPVPAPTAPPKSTPGIGNGGWATVSSVRFLVSVPLPERSSWRIDEAAKETWWTARHAPSASELSVKTWRTSRLSTRDDCKKQVRLWKPTSPDPDARPDSVVERRMLDAPRGFDTELTLGVARSGPMDIDGWAVAVGHTVGECYAAIYTTRASGGSAEASVGERLALFGDGVFPRIERLGVEDRVKP